jgi:hypothetical protein
MIARYGRQEYYMENPDDGTERHHMENPDIENNIVCISPHV